MRTVKATAARTATGFPPLVARDPRALILGSMPGERSLREGQYYAYPHNAFWPIMGALFGHPVESYDDRVKLILSHRLALWDVLLSCEREGSLDADIRNRSIIVNDFAAFFKTYRHITHVFFNGTKAEHEFRRRVLPQLELKPEVRLVRLPSTSPAMASLSRPRKLQEWRAVLKAVETASNIHNK